MWDKIVVMSMGLCMLLASQRGTAAEKLAGQGLRVLSEPEAHCTLVRDGKIIYDLEIGKRYDFPLGLGIASLDYGSHGDVIVTCTHKGFKNGSRTLTFGKMFTSVAAQPCYPPANAADEKQKNICKDYQTTHKDHGEVAYFGYQPNIQVPLEPLTRAN